MSDIYSPATRITSVNNITETSTVISSGSIKVWGFVLSNILGSAVVSIRFYNADQSELYVEIKPDAISTKAYDIPFLADEGLKCTFVISGTDVPLANGSIYGTIFHSHPGA